MHATVHNFLRSLLSLSRRATPAAMATLSLDYNANVICYKELIEKEDEGRRRGRAAGLAHRDAWKPVEPFEMGSASYSICEEKPKIPTAAIEHPAHFRDTVGDESMVGGTPARFGGKWDCTLTHAPDGRTFKPWESVGLTINPDGSVSEAEKKHREVKVGPHDCYCEVGFNCWQSKYLKPPAHGLQGTFEREFFTNTPGELALVWQLGENDKERLKQRMRKNEEAMAKLDVGVAAKRMDVSRLTSASVIGRH